MTESLLEVDPNSGLLLDDTDDLFIKPQKKLKVLALSDHPLAPSGVGVQARFLFDALVRTGHWSFRCLGGAMKHSNYDTVGLNADFVIKPVDGFGNKDMIRNLLLTERPDVIFLFTDPRQFTWVWKMEDEIHQVCPIVYWHVWDNDPYPSFNFPWYHSTDLINCLSYKTYEMVKERFPDKTNYIPHAFPKQMYYALPDEQIEQLKKQNFGSRSDWFVALWVNRNATRKMPADLLYGWKKFLDNLEAKHGHRNATLVMHTDPNDLEGPNLLAVSEVLGLSNNVWFSAEKLDFPQMNVLHNMSDTCVNISKNEGFGLSTLIQMMLGKPIVALKTGGLTRQVEDHRDGSQHGVGITPSKRSLVGSQVVPYIFEDYCTEDQVADAFMKVFEMTPDEKKAMKEKILAYVDQEFNFEQMVDAWDKSMLECVESFKKAKETNTPRWTLNEINPVNTALTSDAREGDIIPASLKQRPGGAAGSAGTSNAVPGAPQAMTVIGDKKLRDSLTSKKITRKTKESGQ